MGSRQKGQLKCHKKENLLLPAFQSYVIPLHLHTCLIFSSFLDFLEWNFYMLWIPTQHVWALPTRYRGLESYRTSLWALLQILQTPNCGKQDKTWTYHRHFKLFAWPNPWTAYFQHDSKVATNLVAFWSHQKHGGWLARFCPTEEITHCSCEKTASKVIFTEDHSRNTAPSSWPAGPQETNQNGLTLMGQDCQHTGNTSSVPGRKASKPASRDSSFKYLSSSGHECTSLLSSFDFFFLYTEATMCMQVELEAFLCSELYGISIIMDVASDSTLLAWIEQDRDNLICHVTAPPDQHCEAILYTEECVPWLEAWWIFRAKEHVV